MAADLSFERAYWGDCSNTYDEETKHWVYAELLGIERRHFTLQVSGRILDIGGGPCSMLLKAADVRGSVVVDPIAYPAWTEQRYRERGIHVWNGRGEDIPLEWSGRFEEAWITNCLQHVEDPERIVGHALRCAPVLRLFEWIDIPPHEGHPQMLTAAALDAWTGGKGQVVELARGGCHGRGYAVVVGERVPAAA